MAINVNDENLNMMDNSAIPEGWEIENNQEITKEQNLANSTIDIPEGWEIESEPSNVSSTMVEQPQMRETYLSAAPKYNLMDNIKRTLNWVNNVRLSAYQEGKNTTRISDLETKDMFGTISDDEKNELNILSNIQPNEYGIEKPQNFYKKEYQTVFNKFVNNPATFAKTSYVEALRMIPMMWETIKAGGVGGAIGGVAGAGVGAAGALATTKANVVPATIKGAQVGSSWGAKIAGSTKVAQLEMGLARNEIKKINQEIIEKGGEELSNAEINTLSIMTGAINGSLELISLKKILKTVPNGDKIIEYLEKGAIKEAIQDGTLRSQIKKISKEYGEAILTETATEMLQETTNVLAERTARGLGKIDQSPLSEDVQRIIETGVTTFGATMFLGGATSGSKVATIYAKQEVDKLNEKIDENLPNAVKKTIYSADFEIQKIKKRAQEFAKSLTPEQQAQYVEDNFDTLVETVNDMPSVQEAEFEQKVSEVEDVFYNKLLKGNVQKDVALANAKLFSNQYRKLETEKARETFLQQLNKLDVEFNIPAEQRENGVYQQAAKDFVGIAGANENEVEDAQREWKEKGTKSKYFKKWFGSSEVTNKNGKPLVVYHGSKSDELIEIFETGSPDGTQAIYFSSSKKVADTYQVTQPIYKAYLKIENPFIVDAQGRPYHEFIEEMRSNIDWAYRNGHDGVIIKNIRDSYYDSNKTKADTYVVFNPEQIKSVDNRGTFDAENPNIYYQNIFNAAKDAIDTSKMLIDLFNKFDANKTQKTLEENKILKPLADYFKDVSSKTYIKEMPDWMYEINGSLGEYLDHTNTIYINLKEIKKITNSGQAFVRVLLHELMHAKQYHLLNYALKNVDNKKLSQSARKMLTRYIVTFNVSKEQTKDFKNNNKNKKISNDKELEKVYKEVHNKYKNAQMELDADNVALALQANIGNAFDENIKLYSREFNNIESNRKKQIKTKELAEIAAFTDRKNGINAEYGRISDYVDTVTYKPIANKNKLLYQSARNSYNEEKKNLVADVYKDQVKFYNGEWIHRSLLEKKGIDFDKVEIGDYLDYFEKSAREPRAEHNPEFDNVAKEYFGTTTNLNEAGYILNDGSLLDLSGKNMGGAAGRRSLDHREVNSAFIETENPDYEDVGFNEFIDNGAIRFMPEANSFLIARMPSEKQFEELKKIIDKKNGEVFIELVDEMEYWGSESHSFRKEYERFSNVDKILDDVITFFNGGKISKFKKYFQESEQDNLIAGYTPLEVMTKSQELYEKLGDIENPVSESDASKILANAHILQDAIDANASKENYTPEQLEDLFLNAYYVMNDQEIPAEILEEEAKSQRTYADYKEIHNKRKEQQQEAYRGYFMEGQDKDLITIMSNQDASTALHELAHWYLNALNEMAKVDEASRKQLDEVDKWLGRSGDYTVSQQEKFARSFEAYLYKGKAPNSYLKEVFENFKQWLKSVYAHITEIEGLGADISKEVEEMFDRMFSNDEYYQERKQANELLKKAKKDSRKQKAKNNIARADRELDEVEKRHKEVSYQILSAATGKSVKYLKTIFETTSENATHAKKREAIINSLDSVEDSIKISGGMREEWKEFYSDTGVDYETSESGADYELVSKALDTILNKSYKNISKDYESEMSDRAEYFENLIKDAEREYKILLNSYKKENRNVALAAIYDWMDSLDSTIKEDFEQKFIYDSRIIERNEHLDKFEKAKRKIIAKALEVENRYGINKDEKYKEVVVEIMKNLNFLQAEDKARLTTNILDVNGVSSLMGQIDSIMDIAKTMEDVNYRRMLQREIHKELQGTKNIKKGARTVGKYDYRTNKLFEQLREYDKLTPEKANELRLDMQKLMSAEENGLNYRQKLINKFLSYKANGMIYADTDLMKEIYDEIVRIKLAGKTAKDEVDLQEKLDESKEIERLVEIVKSKNKDKKKGKANIILRGYIDGFGNLESTLNGIFNKKVADEYGAEILYAETQTDVMQYEIKDKFENEVAKIYDLPKWDWDRQIIKYLGEKYTFQENRRKYDPETFELTKSLTVEKEMTKMDLILAYMWSMNPTLNKRLINMFGEAQLENMFDELSLQDVKFAELMLRTAQSTYPEANKAYIKKYGLDLPKVTAYFPSKVERGTEIDLFNDYSSKSLNNAFTKSRTTSELVPMEFSNPVQILYNHIDGVAKFVNMVEYLDKANVILNNKEFLKPVIIEKFGDDVYKTLTQILLNTTYKAESKVYNGIQKIFDYLSSNWIVANISTRPIVALKQLLSANNYASEMPVMEWSKGFVKSVFDYKNTIDYMMKIPYIKARLGGSMQNEFLKQYVNNSAFARTKKIKDFLAMNVKLGDAGSLIFGGKPYIDYLISQGVSESEAIKQFVLQTNRTQQSSAISSMSNFQVSASRQPLARVTTAYRNAQAQYLRKCADAIIAYTNGDIELKQCAKTVYHYMFLQPFLFNVATSGSLLIWATSGDDEEFWADFKLSMLNLCMDSVGMLAELYNFVLRQIVEGEKYRPVNTPLWGDIQREITRIAKEDAEFEDFVNGFGYLFGNIGTGVPVPAIVNMGEGAVQMVSDDFLTGFFRLLGYSEKRANKMSGN